MVVEPLQMAAKLVRRATAASRSRYTREADARCQEVAIKLAGLMAAIRFTGAQGSLAMSEKLTRVEQQAEAQLAAVERELEQLKDANDETWRDHKRSLEDGWEELSRSMKNIVARL